MKLAILADLHLGYERFIDDSFSQAELAIRKACEMADMILLAGDIFDVRSPKPEVIARSMNLFHIPLAKEWQAVRIDGGKGPRIPVIAIHGTHERRTKDLINPVQIFELAGFFVNVHNCKAVFEKDGERVAVQAIGGVPEDYAINVFKTSNMKPVENAFNVFMLHQTLKDFIPADIDCLSVEDLPKGFDLYVCGHLHAKRISEEKKVLIPGSTVVTQLREGEDGEKGFWLYDTQTQKAEYIPIAVRPFIFRILELKEANLSEIEKSCKETIESVIKDSVVKPILKIKLKGTLAKGLLNANLDLTSLIKEYEPRVFIEIDKEFETNISERVEAIRSFREKKASIKDLGLDILKKRLKESNIEIENVEELFNLLSEDYEAALKKIMEK